MVKHKYKRFWSIFPDTVSDNHTSRLYMALILFGTFLLLFNLNEINNEVNSFLWKYEIKRINETPTKFLEIEKESQNKLENKTGL